MGLGESLCCESEMRQGRPFAVPSPQSCIYSQFVPLLRLCQSLLDKKVHFEAVKQNIYLSTEGQILS